MELPALEKLRMDRLDQGFDQNADGLSPIRAHRTIDNIQTYFNAHVNLCSVSGKSATVTWNATLPTVAAVAAIKVRIGGLYPRWVLIGGSKVQGKNGAKKSP